MSEGQQPPAEPGPQVNPQSQPPTPPPYPQAPYPQAPYPQAPYPQAPYGYGYPAYQRPDHPKATTGMVLGIVSLAGGLMCYLPLLLGPFAWVVNARARREMRRAPGQWDGEGKVTAGLVTSIIATVILGLALIAIAVIVLIGVTQGWDTYDEDPEYYGSALAAVTAR